MVGGYDQIEGERCDDEKDDEICRDEDDDFNGACVACSGEEKQKTRTWEYNSKKDVDIGQ